MPKKENQARVIEWYLNVSPSLRLCTFLDLHRHSPPSFVSLSATALSLHTLNHHSIRLQALLPLLTDTMAVAQKAPKGATLEDEKKKLLQQYKNDDGHFSLVR